MGMVAPSRCLLLNKSIQVEAREKRPVLMQLCMGGEAEFMAPTAHYPHWHSEIFSFFKQMQNTVLKTYTCYDL